MSELLIKINGDVKNYTDALQKAQSKTEDLDATLSQVAKYSAAAFAALTAEVFLAVKAFGDSQQASNKLTASLQNQGIYSQKLFESYRKMASAAQTLTGVDDDLIVSGQSLLQGFIGQQEITQELINATLDLSVAQGVDLETAFTLVGKSIGTSTNALARNGITLEEGMTKAEKTAAIISGLNGLYAGQAEAANKGIGGIKGLTSAFGDLQEEIGKHFEPMISLAIQKIKELFVFMSENKALVDLISGLLAAGTVITGLVAALSTLGLAFISVSALASVFGIGVAALLGPLGLVAGAIVALGVAAGVYVAKSGTAVTETDRLKTKISELRKETDDLEKSYARVSAQQGEGGLLGVRLKGNIDANRTAISGLREELKLLEQSNLGGQDPEKLSAAKRRAKQQEMDELRAAHQEEIKWAMELAGLQDENVKSFEANLQNKIEQLNLQREQEIISDTDFFAQKGAAETLYYDQQIQLIQDFHKKGLFSTVTRDAALKTLDDKRKKSETKNIQDMTKFEETQQKQRAENTRSSLAYISSLMDSGSRELFEIGKAAAMSVAVIDGISAVQKALNTPWPLPLVLAPLVGIAAAANVAKIAGTSFGSKSMSYSSPTGGTVPSINEQQMNQVDLAIAEREKRKLAGEDGTEIDAELEYLEGERKRLMAELEIERLKKDITEYGGSVDGISIPSGSIAGAASTMGTASAQSLASGGAGAHVTLELKDDLVDFIQAKTIEQQNLNIAIQGAS